MDMTWTVRDFEYQAGSPRWVGDRECRRRVCVLKRVSARLVARPREAPVPALPTPKAVLSASRPLPSRLTWALGSGQRHSGPRQPGRQTLVRLWLQGSGWPPMQGRWPVEVGLWTACPPTSTSLPAQGSQEPGETLPQNLKQILRREFWPPFENLLRQGTEV